MAARRSKRDVSRAMKRAAGPAHAPIITLTTDFGTRDAFVGIMKGVIVGIAPHARLIDLTHEVPAQDVIAGAHLLRSAVRWFPRGSIHLAVVDPGVGTRRRAIAVATADAWLIGPDNGLLSFAVPARARPRIIDVSRSPYRLRPTSRTFHGRDVFAPVAAALACGVAPEQLGRAIRSMQRLPAPKVRRTGRSLHGAVLWVDRYGNLTTSIGRAHLIAAGFRRSRLSITIGGHVVPFRSSYAAVPRHRAVALVNSSDLVEIAVNQGSAAVALGAGPGATVRVDAS
jgi:S-adenosyl-L-methionine hydrolase (adenosine-forming)